MNSPLSQGAVRVGPGETVLERIPRAANSVARAFESSRIMPLVSA